MYPIIDRVSTCFNHPCGDFRSSQAHPKRMFQPSAHSRREFTTKNASGSGRLEMRALPAEDMGKHRAQLKALEALLLGASLGEHGRKMRVTKMENPRKMIGNHCQDQ